jgi:tetratricopeptide (TPR) repeat protein
VRAARSGAAAGGGGAQGGGAEPAGDALVPASASLHINLANALDRLGLAEEARAGYERALELEPNHAGALFNLALYAEGAGDARRAVELFRRALESMRRAPERAPPGLTEENAATALALACAAAGMRAEAEEELARVDSLPPAVLLNLRAILASRTGDPDEALELYERVLQADPGFASAHFNVGMALLRKSEAGRALEAFERFARAAPEDPISEFGLGYAHETLGHAELARKHYDEFLRRAQARRRGDAAWTGMAAEFVRRAEEYLRGQN